MKISKTKKRHLPLLEPKFWQKSWQEANIKSSLRLTMSNKKKWIDFWNCISSIYQKRNEHEQGLILKVIDLFFKENLINKDSKVLDIGCGPGTYALPLASMVSHITALDAAPEMLSVLTEQAEQRGIANISPLCVKWEESDFDGEFDFVLAAFSPAIRSAEALLKMNKASCKYASIITHAGLDDFQMRLRNDLWETVLGKKCESSVFHIIYPLNYLYAIGIRPSLRLIKHKILYEEPLEHLLAQYESYFRIFTKLTKAKRNKIYRYLKNRSTNGTIRIDSEKNIYVMWWETSGVDKD